MDYKIIEKESFTIVGSSRIFSYEESKVEIPKFWTEHFQSGKGEIICGMYGVCFDENNGKDEFEYIIADQYVPTKEVPDGYVTKVIPKHTWAVFACKGPMPNSIHEMNEKIYSEWLPNCKDYKIASGYNIELYSDASEYPNGTQDENYYCEIWIPIEKK